MFPETDSLVTTCEKLVHPGKKYSIFFIVSHVFCSSEYEFQLCHLKKFEEKFQKQNGYFQKCQKCQCPKIYVNNEFGRNCNHRNKVGTL